MFHMGSFIGAVTRAPFCAVATGVAIVFALGCTRKNADDSCGVPKSCPKEVVDSSATLSLERTACYGTCPVYTVTLHGDGTVEWKGISHVDTVGAATAKLDPSAVQGLFDLAATSCFFAMRDTYELPITDHDWANTTIRAGNRIKTIRHYQATPESAGMDAPPGVCLAPEVLFEIEKRIDDVTGTAKWIGAGGRSRP